MKKTSQVWFAARSAAILWLPILAVLASPAGAGAQRAQSLSQAKTLYVDAFTGGSDAAALRDSLIHKLSRNDRFRLVQSPAGADAVLKGTGQVWVRGYMSINARTPASESRAVYGGYLSLQVVGADGEPLWSWLVTPGRVTWKNVIDDLAGHAEKKLIAAAAKSASAGLSTPQALNSTAQTTLTGAGATFPAPLYRMWFQEFEQSHPGLYIQYSPVGSQIGVELLVAERLDFAGSDVAPDVAVRPARAAKLRRFATVLGGVVPIYNLKGVTQDLRFTPQALADIYLGRVRRWNDPEIQRTNKDVDLPDSEIAVVHRSDGSGTSWVWSDFLSKVSPAWSDSVGRGTILHWPVGTGAEHNEGVADTVKSTPNSIGYVELTYAIQHQLSFGAVRNSFGEYIHADLDSLAEAARPSGIEGEPPVAISNPRGRYAYPIAAFTWLVIPVQTADPAKRAGLIELLRWILTSGQKECAALGYAPLPRETAENQLRALGSLP